MGILSKVIGSAVARVTSASRGSSSSGGGSGRGSSNSGSKTIADYQRDYAEARARGDADGMSAANRGANAIRAQNGESSVYAGSDIANAKRGYGNTDYSAILTNPYASYQQKADAYNARLAKEYVMRANGTWNKEWVPTNEYQNLLTDQSNPYTQAAYEYEERMRDTEDEARRMYQDYVQQGTDRLNNQRGDINRSYEDASRQAYINYMQGQRAIPGQLASAGVTGGAAESTMLGAQAAYQGALNNVSMGKEKALSDIDMAIRELENSGNMQAAQYILENKGKIAQNYDQAFKADIARLDDNLRWNKDFDTQNKWHDEESARWDKQFNAGQQQDAYERALQTAQLTKNFSIMKRFGWTDEQVRAANAQYASSGSSGGGRKSKRVKKSYASAVSFGTATAKTTPKLDLSGMMTQSEWARHKNSGNDASGASAYDTYQGYVNAYKQFLASKG